MYRDHLVARPAFERIVAAARETGLRALGALDPASPRKLDKRQARRLAEDASLLRVEAALLEHDDDLVAITAVANWCARASGRAWLRVDTH